ncbi:MAG: SCO family protein [Gammaproteobacteria bacterium]|jgi:cytochrome oxidase Cu insertion factor (SCO1/SenC/PrrC family)|nr:SCO family protein [Gammaproteobacteria bacterium]
MNPLNFPGNLLTTLAATLLLVNVTLAHDGVTHQAPSSDAQPVVTASVAVKPGTSTVWGRDYFPNPTLITQDGEKVRFFDDLIEGKVVAINFIYTSCEELCPLETAKLKRVAEILGDRVGKDIFFYSISIDPDIDTPTVLKAYKKKFNVGPEWPFLTGNRADIIELRKKLGLYIDDIQNNPDNPNDHNLSMIIGNQATGRWMKRSPFEDPYVMATQMSDWLHNWKTASVNTKDYADAPKLKKMVPGETIFRTRCSSCHGFGKDGVGPDLQGVTKQRDPAWLVRWLMEPDKMLAEKDPLAMSLFNRYKVRMPNMGLTTQDVEDLINYMEAETEKLSNGTVASSAGESGE